MRMSCEVIGSHRYTFPLRPQGWERTLDVWIKFSIKPDYLGCLLNPCVIFWYTWTDLVVPLFSWTPVSLFGNSHFLLCIKLAFCSSSPLFHTLLKIIGSGLKVSLSRYIVMKYPHAHSPTRGRVGGRLSQSLVRVLTVARSSPALGRSAIARSK